MNRTLKCGLLTATVALAALPTLLSAQGGPKKEEPKKEESKKIVLSGWVLAAEDNKRLKGVVVTATFRDSPKVLTATTDDQGYYEFSGVPLNDVVNDMTFDFPGRNLGLEQKLSTSSDPARPNNVNKALSIPSDVFTFNAYLGQFGAYAYVYHRDTGNGKQPAELVRRYAELIQAMPDPDNEKQLPGLTALQRETLRRVQTQVLQLYGLQAKDQPAPPVPPHHPPAASTPVEDCLPSCAQPCCPAKPRRRWWR
jgi:hypothetical protein